MNKFSEIHLRWDLIYEGDKEILDRSILSLVMYLINTNVKKGTILYYGRMTLLVLFYFYEGIGFKLTKDTYKIKIEVGDTFVNEHYFTLYNAIATAEERLSKEQLENVKSIAAKLLSNYASGNKKSHYPVFENNKMVMKNYKEFVPGGHKLWGPGSYAL